MNRIDCRFIELKKNHRKAFIAFITAGYPNLKATEQLVKELARAKVDIIELGVPFSDPMSDGPVIQEASHDALKKGVSLRDILRLVKRVRKEVDIPLCLMTYYNPIFCFGEREFVRAASAAGVDGVIIPDLPPDEGASFVKTMNRFHLDTILFIAPTTTPQRMKRIAGLARGFIYYVSLTGVTGIRRNLAGDIAHNLRAIKKVTHKPVCVGFGVSDPRQVREIQRIADGVIVGSAIVKKIKENMGHKQMVQKVVRFVNHLKNV
jgi:tryptophan synthase alpha chain